jgi:tetratricopeptide (TPR) repeat protein
MKLNKFIMIMSLTTTSLFSITSCDKSSFEERYSDPGKISSTTVEKQFSGITYSFRELIVPSYWNYFVILRSTAIRYVQATAWANETNQLTPGGASIQDRWNTYYGGLAQFKEFEKIYNQLPQEEKDSKKIFYLAAKILFYNQTHQTIDLHGDIPWSEAGKLSTNGGDYKISFAKYDKGEDIYKFMLDDLKSISTELNSLTIPNTIKESFKTQDIINAGDIEAWKKYCNSLRLRLLTRVSANTAFTARADQEIGEILNSPTTFPLVLTNADNIALDVFNNTSDINSRGFRDGIESWNANIASKVMIDHMNTNADPRLKFVFEPGAGAGTSFIGLDQSLNGTEQSLAIAGTQANPSKIAIYNRSTFSRNEKFPGILISASEVQYLIAEYYVKKNNNASAKTAFEKGIKESIALYPAIRAISTDNTTPASTAPTEADINAYITKIGWTGNFIHLIATQKWLHFNIVQPLENWAEVKRLDYPVFTFVSAPSDILKTVPLKWNLPATEVTYNFENYKTVQSSDNVTTKLFWDVN